MAPASPAGLPGPMMEGALAHPSFYVGGLPYAFPDVREAIDAVSAFEAASAGFHEYDIAASNPACLLTGYTVRVKTDGHAAGWLREG